MYYSGELGQPNDTIISEFERQNPGVKVRIITPDPIRLSAMLAGGQPPDIIRVLGAPDMPSIAARGLAVNLDPYLQRSALIKPADLLPINDVFRWDGTTQGRGPHYGVDKDWSPDATIWYNKDLFDQAGVKYPSATAPLTYDEALALGTRLTVRKNGKVQVYGFDPAFQAGGDLGMYQHTVQMLAQEGKSLLSGDQTQSDFSGSDTRKILQWIVDYERARVGTSVLDPDPNGSFGLFLAGRLAMVTYGYWYQDYIKTASKLATRVGLSPAPQWGSTRVSGCFTATGAWIPTSSPNKDLAWKLFEFLHGGLPATDRATGGHGVPALKHLVPLLPQSPAYEASFLRTLRAELPYARVLRFSPYASHLAVNAAMQKYMTPVILGQTSLDTAAGQLETEVNRLLRIGKAQLGS